MLFSLQLIRKISSTSCLMIKRLPKRSNPGIRYQINAIEEAAEVINSDPEGFDGLESDLFNAHRSYKEHELNIKRENEKIRRCIVKNKYFPKTPLPNLLTYAEKEHIKFLHSRDEEEWTVEKLAESFPASTEIIRKILKAHWNPLSLNRIQSHDTNVSKNWELFNKGEYKASMTTELYEHLKKFADARASSIKIKYDHTQTLRKKQWQRPTSNEFSSIISSLQHGGGSRELKTLIADTPKPNGIGKENDNETYLLGEIKNKKPITIHQLKNKKMHKTTDSAMNSNSMNYLDHQAAQNLQNISGTGIADDNKNDGTPNAPAIDYTRKFLSNEVIIDEYDRQRYGISAAKQRIYIPRKLRRQGATYRANNCYYDDDGEFLYKVPEMTLK